MDTTSAAVAAQVVFVSHKMSLRRALADGAAESGEVRRGGFFGTGSRPGYGA